MEEQNSNPVSQSPINPVPPASTGVPARQANNFLVTLLSVLLLLAVTAAGFFAYQTQNLVRQLRELESVSTPTPTTSPEPIASPDPTADWETYINTKYNYQIKYPTDWVAKSTEPGPPAFDLIATSRGFITYPNTYSGVSDAKAYITIETDGSQNQAYSNYEEWLKNISTSTFFEVENKTTTSFAGTQAIMVSGSYNGYGFPAKIKTVYFSSPTKDTYFSISSTNEVGNTNENIVEQILSTFKFIEPNTSSSPVACTMEAKICPDGSSVGRVAPNCEFAPCPN